MINNNIKDYVRMGLMFVIMIAAFIYLWVNAECIVGKMEDIESEIVCNKLFS